jgi:hypothetical protein
MAIRSTNPLDFAGKTEARNAQRRTLPFPSDDQA